MPSTLAELVCEKAEPQGDGAVSYNASHGPARPVADSLVFWVRSCTTRHTNF